MGTIKVGVLGATGLSGGELVKLLEKHRFVDLKYTAGREIDKIGFDIDCLFLALPHGQSSKIAPYFLAKGIKIIDLGNDFRLIEKLDLNKINLKKDEIAYSIPEIHREKIDYQKIKLLANPGCYPTCAILAIYPLLQYNLRNIIIDAKSGFSGAGKSFVESKELMTKINENIWPYKIAGEHNHNQEIDFYLGQNTVFTPHILPVYRGILETIYLEIDKFTDLETITKTYQDFYHKEAFIEVSTELPSLKDVANTNKFKLAFKYDTNNQKLILTAAIDNLIKGAAGQALQNFNLIFNFDETEGFFNNAS